MTGNSIHLKALEFDHPEDGPSRVTASFPADLLYALATIHGAMPPPVFTPEASAHCAELYHFVSGYVANRFHDDGLDDVSPKYTVFSGAIQLAYHPTGSKDPDAPQQQLAGHFRAAIVDQFGESESVVSNGEREALARLLAQVVINHGWRQVTPIGRNTR